MTKEKGKRNPNLLGQGQSPPLMSKLGPPPPPPPPRPLKPTNKQINTGTLIYRLHFYPLSEAMEQPEHHPPPRPPLPPPLCVNSALRVANDTLMGFPLNSFPEIKKTSRQWGKK